MESETAQSMQTLVELDAVKQRMLESQRALKEADNWTTLLTDVEEVFASQDIDKVRPSGGVFLKSMLISPFLLRLLRSWQACSRVW